MSQTVSQAVAQRDAIPAKVTPGQHLKREMDRYRPVIERLLDGTGINEATFIAQIGNACRVTPRLLECTTETLLGAALRCAQLGLAPNDVRNLAWIIPYKQEAVFQLGYGGVMELARRAMPGLRFDGRAVYPHDEFAVDFGAYSPLVHKPAVTLGQNRGGDAYAWYVKATFPDGSAQLHVLDREGVEYHRKFSKQPQGDMWTKSYDAAALKSVVMEMRRWLPSSAQMVSAYATDETVADVRDADSFDDIGNITHTPDAPEGE